MPEDQIIFDFAEPGTVERVMEYIQTASVPTLKAMWCDFMIEWLRRREAPDMSYDDYRQQLIEGAEDNG